MVELRSELRPPPVSREQRDALGREIGVIAELLSTGAAGADGEVEAFNARTGHAYTALDFTGYGGSRSLDDFATEAARPSHPRVAEVTRDELVEVVRRILAGDPDTDYYLRLLEANVPHPRAADLVFHPSPGEDGGSPERIVDEAMRYRPFAL